MPAFDQQFIFHLGQCLNTKKSFASRCRQCIQFCPHGAINEKKEVNSSKCTDCGVCMAVCPSDGFTDRAINELKEYIFEADPMVLNCPAAQPEGYEINCIGMFDRDAWSTLMLLSAQKEVRIITGDCAICQDVKACAIGVETLKDLLSQWPLPNTMTIDILPWDGKTSQTASSGKAPSPSRNRKSPNPTSKNKLSLGEKRENKKLTEIGKEKLRFILPSVMEEDPHSAPLTRTWLLEALNQFPGQKIPFPTLKISDLCTTCAICVRICPQEALTQHTCEAQGDNDNAPDTRHTAAESSVAGAATHPKVTMPTEVTVPADLPAPADVIVPTDVTVVSLIYQAARCSHCQRCIKVCGPKAISMETIELDSRFLQGKILLHEQTARFCASCSRRVYHKLNPCLCADCAKKDPELKGVLY